MGFNRFLRATFGTLIRVFFRLEAEGLEVFQRIKPPYLLIPNHATPLDPFFVSYFVPRPVHWVTADGNMRTTLMRFILSLVGSIPKAKSIPDMETVGLIMDIARKRKGVVGVFAEGQATWNGRTMPLIESTGKLIRLLKVPVVAVILKGAYLSLPRWSWGWRRGRIKVEYRLVMDGREAGARDSAESLAIVAAAIDHDDCARQAALRQPYRGFNRAQRLELALFLCPRCRESGTMRSSGSRIACRACGAAARMDPWGVLHDEGVPGIGFRGIPDWDAWQAEIFPALVSERAARGEKVISDGGAVLLKGFRTRALHRLGLGRIELFGDRLIFKPRFGSDRAFPLAGMEGIGVLKQQLLEFYQGGSLYQLRFRSHSVSARKWMMALEALGRS